MTTLAFGLGDLGTAIADTFRSAWSRLGEWFNYGVNSIVEFWSNVISYFYTFWSNVLGHVAQWWLDFFEALYLWVFGVDEDIFQITGQDQVKTAFEAILTHADAVAWVLPVYECAAIFATGMVAAFAIRASRWVISYVPFLGTG